MQSTKFLRVSLSVLFVVIGLARASNVAAQSVSRISPYSKYRSDPSKSSGTFDLRAYSDGLINSGRKVFSLSIGDSGDSSECVALGDRASLYDAAGMWQQAYDSNKYYIEHCYYLPWSWGTFGYLNGEVSNIPTLTDAKWLSFRQWLFKVLYLNSDSNYYCADVGDMISTFNYVTGPRKDDEKGILAVERFIINSGKCAQLSEYFRGVQEVVWNDVYRTWADTVKDTLATPFDSTLPSLQEIGFEILLGPQYAAEHSGVMPTSVLGVIVISPNPFRKEAEITYELNVPATLTIEVFDALGSKINMPSAGIFTSNGQYSVSIGAALAPGMYYVRFSVPEGEVRTVKIVKE
jgi:hypothetical protein